MTSDVAATGAAEPSAARACANCGAALHGRFCHACGQDDDGRTDSLRSFLRENLSDLAHLDSRGLRTFRDLFIRPGRLTAAYFEGHRVRYLGAVQLYLIAAALFFFASSFSPFIDVDGEAWTASAALGAMSVSEFVEEEDRAPLVERGITAERFEDRLRATATSQMPAFLVGVVLVFALLVAIVHLRRERNLLRHLVFALHWVSFYLVIMIGERIVGRAPGNPDLTSLFLGLIGLIWMTTALRRAYQQLWALALIKAIFLFIVFHALLAAWLAAVFTWGIRSMA